MQTYERIIIIQKFWFDIFDHRIILKWKYYPIKSFFYYYFL